MKIKKGDQVKIISGNDKGKIGKIILALPEEGKIVVEGINMKKKHVRPKRQGQKGELVRMPVSFPASRVMLVCPKCNQASRVGVKKDGDEVYRVCKKCKELI